MRKRINLRLTLILIVIVLTSFNQSFGQIKGRIPIGPLCSFNVSPTSVSLPALAKKNNVIAVQVTSGTCSWTVSDNVSWITASASGTGSGSFAFTTALNSSFASRTGTITVTVGTTKKVITVTQAGMPPSIPPTPSIANYNGYTKLTRATPPSGVTYYWQGKSCGTSTSNSSSSYNASSSGTYYIRARANSTGTWSVVCRSKALTVYSNPTTPGNPSPAYSHNSTVVSKSATSSGCTMYWQTSSTGASTSNSASTKTITSNGQKVYLRQRHNTSGLWSSARTYSVIVYSNPSTPAIPSLTFSHNSTLVTKPAASSHCTMYWQTSSTGASTSNSASTKTITTNLQNVYLRQRNNSSGLWSNVLSKLVRVHSNPSQPDVPTVIFNDGSTSVNLPGGDHLCTSYWQTSASGTSKSNSAAKKAVSVNGQTVYVRSRNNVSGLWSSARLYSVTVYSKPSTPSNPSHSYSHNSTVVTKPLTSSGCIMYWQSSSSGASTSNSASTQTVTSNGQNVYLRQRHNTSGLWSTARTYSVLVYSNPSTPAIPSFTFSHNSTLVTKPATSSHCTMYWQTSSTGSSTTNSASTKTVTTNGQIVYLRQRNNSTGLWSAVLSKLVRVYSNPSQPDVPTVTFNDGSTSVNLPGSDHLCTSYWQTSASGISKSNSAAKKTVNVNGETVYIRARNNVSGLWSAARLYNVTVYSKPSMPSNPSPSYSHNSTVVTKHFAPSGCIAYWQSSSSGQSTTDDATTKQISTNGQKVYLRHWHSTSGLWSNSGTYTVSVYSNPSSPSDPTTAFLHNSTIATKPAASSGCVMYWQTSVTGTSILNLDNTQTITSSSQNVYVRQRNSTSGLWSTTQTFYVFVYSNPSQPDVPTLTYNDGSTSVNLPGSDHLCISYWQTSAIGTSTSISNSAAKKSVNVNGETVYIRARNMVNGLWSDARTTVVNVYNKPPAPSDLPSKLEITYNDGNTKVKLPQANAGCSVYWQTSDSETSSSDDIFAKIFNLESIVYFRQVENTCGLWSDPLTLNVNVYTKPIAPSDPSILESTHNKTIVQLPAAAANTIVYWQDTESGEETGSNNIANKEYDINDHNKVIYVRAKDTRSGLWSSATAFTVYVFENPDMPIPPTYTYSEGQTVINLSSPGHLITYYWQNAADGTSTENSVLERNFSVADEGTYYVRAKRNIVNYDFWSEALPVIVNIKEIHSITPSVLEFDQEGSLENLSISADEGLEWSVGVHPLWLNVLQSGSTGTAGIKFTCTVNDSYVKRIGSFYIGSHKVNVSQLGNVPPVPNRVLGTTNICAGTNGTYFVTPHDDIDFYEWEVSEGYTITANSHGPSIDVTVGTLEGQIKVRAKNDNGYSDYSVFNVNSIENVLISEQPIDKLISVHETTSLELLATGNALSFNWQVKEPSSTFVNYTGTVNSTANSSKILQLGESNALDGNVYRCVVSNQCATITSSSATLDIVYDPVITQQPQDVIVDETQNTSFSIYGDHLVSYKWQVKESGASVWSDLGQTSSTLVIPSVNYVNYNGNTYRCIVSNPLNVSLISNEVNLQVNPEISIISITNDNGILTATVEGLEPFTYLWSTGETASFISTNGTGIYSVKVTDAVGKDAVNTHDFGSSANNHFDHNFVKTETALEAVKTESGLAAFNEDQKSTSFNYMDGLGRLMQTVAVKASPTYKDIIQYHEYDELGRKVKEYLPYTIISGGGTFRDIAKSEQENFYFTNPDGANDVFPFTEKTFDYSPLSRVMQQNAPGTIWHKGQGHNSKNETKTNDIEIDRWIVDASGNCIKDEANEYAINDLYKTGVKDENDVWSYEYKDSRGNLILSKTEDLETYYVYDQLNRLAFILPPKALDEITGTTIPADIYNELIFAYMYDEKGRVISKKIPGAGEVYMVYDNLNRLVLAQDAVKRVNDEWSFIKYDLYGRPVISGMVVYDTKNHDELQTYFKEYTGVMYEDKDPTLTFGYTLDNSFSSILIEDAHVYSATYFDNYEYLEDFSLTVTTPLGYPTVDPNLNVTGQQTGSQVRILGTSDYLLSVSYYDDKGQVIRTDSHNQLEGENHVFFNYDFAGKVLKSYSQTIVNEGAADEMKNILVTEYEYDHAGRLLNEYSNTSTSATTKVLLANYEYNELGSLSAKNLHSTDNGSNFLQSVDYKYNIRGWLTQINDPDNTGNDLFSQKLFFNNTNSKGFAIDPLYNGNITGIEWKTTGIKMAYNFSYDKLSRLSNAYYGDETDWNNGLYDMSVLKYDKNGNIEALSRNADAYGEIDNLDYEYTGNRLIAVGDNAIGTAGLGFNDGTPGKATTEYLYDGNGNMIEDYNKNMSFYYNKLNLLSGVTKGANSFDITYSASGGKLSTVNNEASGTNSKYYVGAFNYAGTTETFDLAYILTTQGRITFDADGKPQYEYFLHDHLGSVRASFGDYDKDGVADILQEDHYYPFGMQMPQLSGIYNGAPNNNYLYNGKELHTEMDINWHDYGSRFYDAALARWHAIDPQTEKMAFVSPYNYTFNNPINFTDPNGEDPLDWIATGISLISWGAQMYDGMVNHDASFGEAFKNSSFQVGYNGSLDFNANYEGNLNIPTYDEFKLQQANSPSYAQGMNTEYNNYVASSGGIVSGISLLSIGVGMELNNIIKIQSQTAVTTGKFYCLDKNLLEYSSSNPKLSSFGRVSKNIGTAASFYTTSLAYINIASGDNTIGTYADATVGSIGLLASGASYFSGAAYPGVGFGVAIYGAGRLGYDIGLHYHNKMFHSRNSLVNEYMKKNNLYGE